MKTRTPTALVEHAGSGFLMPEETARRIENLSRGLPRDFTYRRRSAPAAELELNAGERTDVSTITTDALDRDRECVLPGGGDWSAYNRVVPFAHDYRQLPAGSCWWIKPKGGKGGRGPRAARRREPRRLQRPDRQDALPGQAGRLGRRAVAAFRRPAPDAAGGADLHRQEHRLRAAEHPRGDEGGAWTAGPSWRGCR